MLNDKLEKKLDNQQHAFIVIVTFCFLYMAMHSFIHLRSFSFHFLFDTYNTRHRFFVNILETLELSVAIKVIDKK